MFDVFRDVLGYYEPIRDVSGAIVSGLAGIDWPWLIGFAIFAVSILSVFKLLGGIFRHD